LFLLLFAGNVCARDDAEPKPSVLILTAGGAIAIASRTDAPLIDGTELIQAVPVDSPSFESRRLLGLDG
jgi:hypothetical protein